MDVLVPSGAERNEKWCPQFVDLDADWYAEAEFCVYEILQSTRNALRALGMEIEFADAQAIAQIGETCLPNGTVDRFVRASALKELNRLGAWPCGDADWVSTRRKAARHLRDLEAFLEDASYRDA